VVSVPARQIGTPVPNTESFYDQFRIMSTDSTFAPIERHLSVSRYLVFGLLISHSFLEKQQRSY